MTRVVFLFSFLFSLFPFPFSLLVVLEVCLGGVLVGLGSGRRSSVLANIMYRQT